jgi:hypothetical protein
MQHSLTVLVHLSRYHENLLETRYCYAIKATNYAYAFLGKILATHDHLGYSKAFWEWMVTDAEYSCSTTLSTLERDAAKDVFPTAPENELEARYAVMDQGFLLVPRPEFGAQTNPYDYEIWTNGSYFRHKDIGGCSAIIVSRGPLGGLSTFSLKE